MLDAAISDLATDSTPEVSSDTDAALARLAAAGDTPAFEALYRRHCGRMHGVIVRLVGA